MSFKRNTAVTGLTFTLVSRTDGSPITTGTVDAYISKDGSTQAALTATPAHLGNGQWSVDLTAGEMDADLVGLLLVHPDAVAVQLTIRTTDKLVSDLHDVSQPQITGGAYALDTDANGRVRHVVGTAAGELNTQVGSVPVTPEPAVMGRVDDVSPTPASFAGISSLSSSDDFYNGAVVAFTSGILKGLARRISDYTGTSRTLHFDQAFPTAPGDDDHFVILGRID